MPKEHRLKTRKTNLPIMVPLNFLLGCSQVSLDSYELARLAETAYLRTEFHALFDRLIQESALATLAKWFRESDRTAINQALALEEDPLTWAKRQISERGRSEEELLPLPSLPPGAAHLAAALRYPKRNIAEGKCSVCPQPLDPNSVCYCTKHLAAARMRHKPKGGEDPGSIDYLYQDHTPEKRQGRQPGTLQALAIARAQKQRKILAELGIPPEGAAITLDAAKESLMKHMPDSWHRARVAADLWQAALIPSLQTGKTAIKELLAEGTIQRVGEGHVANPYRYFRAEAAKSETSKDKNRILLQTLRGEEPDREK